VVEQEAKAKKDLLAAADGLEAEQDGDTFLKKKEKSKQQKEQEHNEYLEYLERKKKKRSRQESPWMTLW